MSDARDELRLSLDTALRESMGLAGLFADVTPQIDALLPLFDAHRAEVLREAAKRMEHSACLAGHDDPDFASGMGWAASEVSSMAAEGEAKP